MGPGSCPLRGILKNKKLHTPCTPRAPRAFDVCPPMRFTTLWTALCIMSTHHALHRTNANLGGRLEGVDKSIKMTDEPSDVSEVANNTSDVPEQVPGKKQDTVHNKEMLAFWKNSRHQVLRTSSLMKRRHKF